ncbi:hypothetical protein [Lutispora thermophila]|uniref:Uncharacterized protein n=1 Tax=Lutispora thermophila DSM 19022 TaxID=1122184 RepID=A0A1M6J431_9FIRM|nr:hypothetical protein [Lutispora thermophila]SHJ41446.1 hypothetical protein SAMN02745176_03499 [Lutispora thermophila DSM 19022]
MNISIFNLAWQSAEKIFLNPSVLYKYEDIIKGVTVNGIRKKAVDINTTQAFGKKLNYGNFYDNKIKAMEVFDEVFLTKKDHIINELQQVRKREEIDVFEHKLFMSLQEALLPYSTPTLLKESYNRIRKIVDLYLEHIVAMAEEIDSATRERLMPLLFLPIDSWIIKNEAIFDSISIYRWGLTRDSSFGEVRTKNLYDDMQRYLLKKANEISMRLGKEFSVIYFDVFWNNRLNMPGCNLFGEQIAGITENMKADRKETKDSRKNNLGLSDLEALHKIDNNTSYPMLVKTLINELAEISIYLDKDYKCIKRNDGGYIFEAICPRGRRKNIVTVWPNKQGGGDIRIVGIGKYENRRRFDQSDIGANALKEDLRKAYRNTQ